MSDQSFFWFRSAPGQVVHHAAMNGRASRSMAMHPDVAALVDQTVGEYRARRGSAVLRLANFSFAAIVLIVLAPVLAVICLAIWLQDGAAPFFIHWRIGRDGIPFPCLKLRTMVVDSERRLEHLLEIDSDAAAEWALDQKLRDDPRITQLGSFLRRSSLDEVPQLFNVLAGQMSIVGPRPIVAAEVPRYGRYIRDYIRVRPGITGLWQVSGRNLVSYRRRVAIDTLYARQKSLIVDFIILSRTLPALLSRRGAT